LFFFDTTEETVNKAFGLSWEENDLNWHQERPLNGGKPYGWLRHTGMNPENEGEQKATTPKIKSIFLRIVCL